MFAPVEATFGVALTSLEGAGDGVDVAGAFEFFVLASRRLRTVRYTFFFNALFTIFANHKVFAFTPGAVALASLGSFLADLLAFRRASFGVVGSTNLAGVSYTAWAIVAGAMAVVQTFDTA